MIQICKHCERILREGEEVIATVVAQYKTLGSEKIYAITKPTECLEISHRNCNHTYGAPNGD